MKLCNKFKRGICAKKRENLSLVWRRERKNKRVYLETDKKEIYLTIKVTTDYASIFS